MQEEVILEGFRLSPQQKRLWLLQQADGGASYRVQCTVSIIGALRPAALAAALREVVARHEILRTSFELLPEMTVPLQLINDDAPVSIAEQDLSGLPAHEQEARIEDLLAAARQTPVELRDGAALQATLLKLAADRHALILTLPALCADQPTLRHLVREIARSYDACARGESADDEPTQYVELAEWQNELLESEDTAAGRDYWRHNRPAEQSAVKLPFEQAPSVKTGFDPQVVTRTVAAADSARICALARQYDASPAAVLLACWQALLARVTGQAEITVGFACDGRKYDELKSAIGLLTKYLPLQGRLSGQARFGELVAQAQAAAGEVYKWQECFTWEQTDEPAPADAAANYLPLCFTFVDDGEAYTAAGVTFALTRQYECTEKFKLKLACAMRGDALHAEFHFDAALFDRAEIERLADRCQQLLQSVSADPDVRLDRIEVLGAAERRRLLVEFNDTRADYGADKCIHQLFEAQAARTPVQIAVAFDEQRLTYYELNARANQLAHHLRKLGVGPETPVGLCIERSPRMVVGLLGILKAGGAYVPIDPHYPQQRRAFMLADTGARVLVTQQALAEPSPADVQQVCLDSDWAAIAQNDRQNPRSAVTPANLMYVIYTSGSTGAPKGVMVEHRSVANYLAWMQAAYPLTAADRLLQTTSISFDVSVRELFWPLLAGAQVVLLEAGAQQDSSRVIDLLARHKITQVRFVPSMLAAFLEAEGLEACRDLKRVFCGGEAMPPQLPARFFARFEHVELHNTYGPTEASVNATAWACRADDRSAHVAIGRPLANVQVYLLNEALQPVPLGTPGELYIGGRGVARGYLNRPELTAERFVPDPFGSTPGTRLYRTGDVARYRPDGNIEFLGRNDTQVQIHGYRVELGEVEAALTEHDEVRVAVVEALPDATGERRLVAYVVPGSKTHRPNVSELRAHLLERLPEYMIPAAFVLLDALPLTPNGKVDRRALPAPDQNRPDLEKAFVAPRDELERQLAALWEEVLNVRPVGVRDNFFELGGHSLLALRVMAQVQKLFGKDLPLATLIQGGTVEHLAKLLRQENPSLSQQPLVAIKPDGTRPPFFAVHSVGGQVFCYVQLARLLGKDQPFYGLQAPSLNESEVQQTSIEEMAAHYVSAVREVQAEGPYFLGGYSFGGMVAFEMAQQLRAEGQAVALVALLDSRSPRVFNLLPAYEENDAFMLAMLGRVHAQERGQKIDITAEEFLGLDYEAQMAHFLERMTAAELLPPDMTIASLRTFLVGYKARQKAMRHYKPGVYPGALTLYRAEEQDTWMLDNLEQAGVDVGDPTMGWGQLSAEPVTVYDVPGNHDQICYKPHVKVLAKQLRAAMEQALAPPDEAGEAQAAAAGHRPLDWMKKRVWRKG